MNNYSMAIVAGFAAVLAACQAEKTNGQNYDSETQSIEERLDYLPPEAMSENMPHLEGGIQLVKPSEEQLAAFLAKGNFPNTIPDPIHLLPMSTESPSVAEKAAAGYACTIDYNNANAIALTPRQAWDTEAFFPWYIQSCGNNSFMYTVPLPKTNQAPLETHHHLIFENPYICNIDIVTGTQAPVGKIGVYQKLPTRAPPRCADWTFYKCTFSTVDAKNFARYLTPHSNGFWMQFFPKKDNKRKNFDLVSMRILPNTFATDGCEPNAGKIQVWVKKAATQQWWYWDGLLPGYTWSPYPNDGAGLDELQIASATGVNGPFKVDDIKVNIHY